MKTKIGLLGRLAAILTVSTALGLSAMAAPAPATDTTTATKTGTKAAKHPAHRKHLARQGKHHAKAHFARHLRKHPLNHRKATETPAKTA